MNIGEARNNVGGLSDTRKMPGESYSVPIEISCHVGKKLAMIPGSVCSKCYADPDSFGRYGLDEVQNAQQNRFQTWQKNRARWKKSMLRIFDSKKMRANPWFRWFDAGDIYSEQFLQDILEVCAKTPWMSHWIPTKEYGLARKYQHRLPSNVTLRVSHPMLNQINSRLGEKFTWQSAVATQADFEAELLDGFHCPSSKQDHQCKDCRACWQKDTDMIVYKYTGIDANSVQREWGKLPVV